MFDIITSEPNDAAVKTAVETVKHGVQDEEVDVEVVSANGEYVFSTPNSSAQAGDGGASRKVLVVVGHGAANILSGCQTWAAYKRQFSGRNINWAEKTQVYLVSCSTAAGSNHAFLHGNFAREVKADFPNATVWASETAVNAATLAGDWQKVV